MQRLIIPILLGLAVLGLAGLVWFPSIAQPQWYHDFADQRSVLGIANFWNVISNFPFVFIGGLGIWHVARGSTRWQIDSSDRWMYLSFFAAVALMGVGSAFYHLRPNNDRLVWDRLPIAVTFMALFAIIITGISKPTGRHPAFCAARAARRGNGILLVSDGDLGKG